MHKNETPVIIFAGGGTGGHVYPGIAVANALADAYGVTIRWIGTEDRMEANAVPKAGFEIDFLKVAFIKGRRGLGLVKAFVQLPVATLKAMAILRRHRPRCVVGLGGFVSGPACAAAYALGIPVFLMEQNARPGITNRQVAKIARHIFGSFEASRSFFPAKKLSILGNPVRTEILALRGDSPGHTVEPTTPRKVLVFGGSGGAATLNEGAAAFFKAIQEEGVVLDILHGAGRGRSGEAQAFYDREGITAKVQDYIDDMAAAYAWADLVVCRAGATTIAELTVVGQPAVYVPFPYAADDHQTANAKALEDAGAGVLISDAAFRDAATSGAKVAPLLKDPVALTRMGEAAFALGRPDATRSIAREIWERSAR